MYDKTISSVNFDLSKFKTLEKLSGKNLLVLSVFILKLSAIVFKKKSNNQSTASILNLPPLSLQIQLKLLKILSFKYTRSQSSLHWFAWFRHLEFLLRLSQSIFVLRLSNFHLNLVFQDAAQKNSQIKKRRIRGWRKRFFKFWGQRIQ